MKISKKKLILLNSTIGVFYEIVSIICGMILPRLILGRFGSSYNGITSAITQFLSFIAIVRGGLGGAAKVHLYKSLANNNNYQTNVIMKSISKFMNRVSVIYIISLLVLSVFYPILFSDEFEWFFTFSLVLIIGTSALFDNLLGISSMIILQADQREYVMTFANIFAIVFNTLVAAILIKSGCSIHIVKLGSAVVFTVKPMALALYAKKHYNLNGKNIKPDMSLLSQRKDAVVHTIAEFVHLNTDVILLTFFSSSVEISVYGVYHIIVNGLRKLVRSFTSNIEALFGSLHAENKDRLFKETFHSFEYFVFAISTLLFTCAAVLSEPFVMIYTHGVNDANYSRVTFAVIIFVAEAVYSIRLPYQFVIRVYGKFKETKWISVSEAILNILISIVLILLYLDPLVGISVGTLMAMLFRTIMYGRFVCSKILHDSYLGMIKGASMLLLTLGTVYFTNKYFITFIDMTGYFEWLFAASIVFVYTAIIVAIVSILLFRNEVKFLFNKFLVRKKRGN